MIMMAGEKKEKEKDYSIGRYFRGQKKTIVETKEEPSETKSVGARYQQMIRELERYEKESKEGKGDNYSIAMLEGITQGT